MTRKEVIDWQFNDLFYKLLVDQLNSIRVYMINQKYDVVYKELVQIFNNMNYSIYKEDKDRHQELLDLIKEIDDALYNFQSAQVNRRMPRLYKAKIMTKHKYVLEEKIHEFHRLMMATMDRMNMLFKRSTKDYRSGEQKFDDKYIKPELR